VGLFVGLFITGAAAADGDLELKIGLLAATPLARTLS
jgi:hypothetical protein